MPTDELSPLIDGPALGFLAAAEIEIEGRMPWSSNATFLVNLTHEGRTHQAIYKPVRGERPLWDFEPGLHRRECAAYHLSHALGIQVVPPTVIRDGPFGEGSVQWFVDADHSQHYFTIFENREDLHEQLRRIAAFDFVANNTDRKSGHCLIAGDHVWGIDHGLCFAADFKLRTVIWEFSGEPIDANLISALEALRSDPPSSVTDLLSDAEAEALLARTDHLITTGEFPGDETGQRYPWPLV
jgi:uncharacterized repeat protein (TIGR03843 family)